MPSPFWKDDNERFERALAYVHTFHDERVNWSIARVREVCFAAMNREPYQGVWVTDADLRIFMEMCTELDAARIRVKQLEDELATERALRLAAPPAWAAPIRRTFDEVLTDGTGPVGGDDEGR